jgi:hypothetical protein
LWLPTAGTDPFDLLLLLQRDYAELAGKLASDISEPDPHPSNPCFARNPPAAWLLAAKAQAMLAHSQNTFEIRLHSIRNAD